MWIGGYEDWAWTTECFDRIQEMKNIPHIDTEQPSHFDLFGKSIIGKPCAELLLSLKTEHYSAAELHYIEYMAYGNFIAEWFANFSAISRNKATLTIGDNDPNAKKAAVLFADANHIIPLIQKIDALLTQETGVPPDPMLISSLEFMRDDMPKVFIANVSDMAALLRQLSKEKANPNAELFYVWYLCTQDQIPENEFLKGKEYEWWKPEYWIWLAHWSEDAVVEIHQHDYPAGTNYPPVSHDMHKLISQFGLNCFSRDINGNGQEFLPGLFFLTWYAQTFDIQGHEELEQKFKDETLIPFDTYLSSLYRIESRGNSTAGFHIDLGQ